MRRLHYLFLLCFLLAWGCEDPMERYEVPDWIAGSLWETLEEKGSHSLFLEGIEKAGFKRAINGKGNYTVIAPDDEAIKAWLNENGYSSLNDLSADDLHIFITSHILNKPVKGEDLVNYNNKGAGNEHLENWGENIHHTIGMKTPAVEVDDDGYSYGVYYGKKLLGFFGTTKFNLLGINDPKTSFEYLFGNDYNSGSYYAANAELIEGPISAENGYVYIADEVVEPLFQAQRILSNKNNTSALKLFDRYNKYVYRSDFSDLYSATLGKDSVYVKAGIGGVPSIAQDFTANPSYHAAYDSRSALFVPNNVALDNFLQSFFGIDVSEVDQIPVLAGKQLLKGWLVNNWTLPETIEKGEAISNTGDAIELDLTTDIDYTRLGSNYLVYGTKKVVVSNPLLCVTGPAYMNADMNEMSALLEYAERVIQISGTDIEHTLLIPSNAAIAKHATFWNDWGETNKTALPSIKLEGIEPIEAAEKKEVTMFVDRHIIIGRFEFSDKPVYANTLSPFHVVIFEDGKIKNGDDIIEDDIPVVEESFDMLNGFSYKVNNTLEPVGLEDLAFTLESNFSKYYGYLQSANLITQLENAIGGGDHLQVFAPSNEALAAAELAGEIPTDPEKLKDFLKYFIISMRDNGKSNYYLPAYQYNGEPNYTNCRPAGELEFKQLKVYGNGSQLQVSNFSNTESANILEDHIYVVVGSVITGIDDIITYTNN